MLSTLFSKIAQVRVLWQKDTRLALYDNTVLLSFLSLLLTYSVVFYALLQQYLALQNNPQVMWVQYYEHLLRPFFSLVHLIFFFTIPVFCCGLINREVRSGAYDFILRMMVSPERYVLSKYALIVALSGGATLLLLPFFLFLALRIPTMAGHFWGTGLGIFLAGVYYGAIALWFSARCRTYGLSFLNTYLWYLGVILLLSLGRGTEDINEVLLFLNPYTHVENFFLARIELKSLFFFLGGIYFLYELTALEMQKKRDLKIKRLRPLTWLLLVCLVVGSLFFHRGNWSFPLTQSPLHRFSPELEKALSQINSEIQLLTFLDASQLREKRVFLDKLQRSKTPITWHNYDPVRQNAVLQKYQISSSEHALLLVGEAQVKLLAITAEVFQEALRNLFFKQEKLLCFSQGFAEHSLAKKEWHFFNRFLKEQGWQQKVLRTLSLQEKLQTCDLLFFNAPQRSPEQKEEDLLDSYLKKGGRIVMTLEMKVDNLNAPFASFLKERGIGVTNQLVVDRIAPVLGGQELTPIISFFPGMKEFQGRIIMPITRALTPLDPENVVSLASTGAFPASWAESEPELLVRTGKASFQEGQDLPGPNHVVLWQKKAGQKIMVLGSSQILSNHYFHQLDNRQFLSYLLYGLLDIPRHNLQKTEIYKKDYLTLSLQKVGYLLGGIALVVALGIVWGGWRFWWRKRRSQ